MAGKAKLAALVLTAQQKAQLNALRHSRSEPLRKVERAGILWQYHAGLNPSQIAQAVKVSRVTILAMGVEAGRKDNFHRPKEPLISSADKAWVVHLACSKPKDLGDAAALWTRSALAAHVRPQAQAAGHPSLLRAAKSTVQKIKSRAQTPAAQSKV